MAYKTKVELTANTTITLGGVNEATGKANPTSIEGFYLGSRVTPDKGYGPGLLHFFQTPTGNVGVWGKTRLNNLLTSDVKGQMCLVTFMGMGTKVKGKRPPYTYKLQHDEDNVIDVTGLDLSEVQEEVAGDESDQDAIYDDDRPVDTEPPTDEVQAPRAIAPPRPAAAPDAARQAKVQALLNKSRKAS